jgi:hypothetical protein
MDKSTKLEKLFDRMALVDARFEVVKAAARTEFLRSRLEAERRGSAGGTREDESSLEERIREANADRDFLRECNVGTEAMEPANIVRIREIARKYRWVDPQGEEVPILSEEEIRNLSVLRGTLTDEDREIINYHIIATTRMLEGLPYPKYLKNVPLYAGARITNGWTAADIPAASGERSFPTRRGSWRSPTSSRP